MDAKRIFAITALGLFVTLIYFEFGYVRNFSFSKIKASPLFVFRNNYTFGLGPIKNGTQIFEKPGKTKMILVYTNLFGNREWYHLPGNEAKDFTKKQKCKVNNCEISYDNNRISESDAVIFHARDMPDAGSLRDVSAKLRPLHQRWVYFISENPFNTPNPAPLNGLFNWTMTYKKESDIWIPYKRYAELEQDKPRPKIIDYAAEKNKVPNRKLALWVVSHCGQLRDKLVHQLDELIPIDVGGGCGGQYKHNAANCNIKGREGCMQAIKNYKFYFSFENNFCDQYVTEKYWYNALEHDSVPIVLGAGPYNDPKVAIPGSFINVADFKTAKDLAAFLLHLDQNDAEYNKYFEWKQKYYLPAHLGWPYPGIWGCEICEKLHNDRETRIYDKLSEFWNAGKDCNGKDRALNEMINRA